MSHTLDYLDVNRAALFSKSDAKYVRRQLFADRIDAFNERLERVLADQTAYDDLVHRHLEPLQVRRKVDLVVNSGLQRLAKLATGKTTSSFTHVACGTGTNAENAGDTALQAEVRRIACTDRFDSGTSMKFSGFFDSTTATGSYTEFGLFDASSGGNMFSRTVFSPAINHAQNSTVFVLTQVVSQAAS
ncbi:hypothetical protein [Nitrososphaera viennensis]|uniref:Uncharacterized protein n=2 Tax=Nitrososphaera viennensis TaxID=1034015 RepID=A0A977IDM2_9ARCH|nr:hypothetical protein [Nitrososphaera viennensis]AIC16958.1 putative tail fiber protein [Nitrososphaera viennensis EN76]UVS68861.1 hypothetical protein NWT39_13250 [Nitrososphaera viennensis]CBX88968.1 putative tail fiber protein [Nitrososphaera phage Pro-Nvie1]